MTVQNDPSDHPRDDPEPSEADYWNGVAAIGGLISAVLLFVAKLRLEEAQHPWQVALLSLAILLLSLAVLGCFVFIVYRSDWYSMPLPRTDPDEPPDSLRPTSPEQDHRTY